MTDQQRVGQAAHLLKAIAHPLRMRILMQLATHPELTVTALQTMTSTGQSLMSTHLLIMRKKGCWTPVGRAIRSSIG